MAIKPFQGIVFPMLALLLPLRALAAGSTPSAPSVTFTQIMPRQTIFNWAKTACSPDHFIPDGPARAWKRADGKFALIAEEADNWQLVGSSPFDLRASCKPILSAVQYDIGVRGYVGIEATYTFDGQTIYGFAGQDLSPVAKEAGCVDDGGGNCWLNDITAVISKDMGNDFDFVSPGNGDVAALSHVVSSNTAGRNGQDGYITTSNIIRKPDGYFYMVTEVANAETGILRDCLIRTSNLADTSSWRAMNVDSTGTPQFNGVLQPVNGSVDTPCTPVGGGSLFEAVYSINYIPAKKLYIALMQARLQLPGDSAGVPGAYYATSPDLINWGPVKRLLVTPIASGYDSQTEIDAYPVLMDMFSKSRNFETIDSITPVVIYTLVHAINGSLTFDRDIVAVPFVMR